VSVHWRPFREPLRATVARTSAIAAIVGLVVMARSGGGAWSWIVATLVALWPAFGGHWVELFFLDWLRPKLSSDRGQQVGARLVVWFAGGVVLWAGMYATLDILSAYPPRRLPWWVGGAGFIAIELVVHLVLQLRGLNSVYNGRG
jgi:hypothetical protein